MKGRIILKWHRFLKEFRKALFVSDIIEKMLFVSKAIDDTCDGLEELEKELKHKRKILKNYKK